MGKAIVLGALMLAAPATAGAQSLGDDVECLMLGNAFARQSPNEAVKRVSALTSAFYLGRVDARATPATLAAAMREQRHGLAGPATGRAMQACAARADAANRRVVAIARQIAPPRR